MTEQEKQLKRIADLLECHLGDTDPVLPEDQDVLEDEFPVHAAMRLVVELMLAARATAEQRDSVPHIPAIKGAWIDGGYVIVTPTGTGNAPALKAAILALASLTAPIPSDCDVRKILLRVVPGDGSGLEVYAENVQEVEGLLSEMGERLETYEASRATTEQSTDVRDLEQTLNAFAAAQRGLGAQGESQARVDSSNVLYQKLLDALKVNAKPVMTDDQISDMVENADGMRCVDGEYRIDGRDLMNLIRALKSQQDAAIESKQAEQPDPIRALIAVHAEQLEQNDYAYFELAYTRHTAWMAWLCSNSRDDDPNRKVLAKGQGHTPEEACAAAIESQRSGDGS